MPITVRGNSSNSVIYTDDTYSPTVTDGSTYVYVQGNREWIKGYGWPLPVVLSEAQNKKEEVKDMRGLFHVVVVEYKTDRILEDRLVIAKDKETAKIKALAPFADACDLDDLDAICNRLGDVRKKKEVQKVEIVEKAVGKE